MTVLKPMKAINAGVVNAPNASVAVYQTGTFTPVNLYADALGATPITNPTSLDNNGRLHVYAADGRYDVSITLGSLNFTVMDVETVDQRQWIPVGSVTPTTFWNHIFAGDVNYLAWNMTSTDGVNARSQNSALPSRAILFNSDGSWSIVYQTPTVGSFTLSGMRTDFTVSAGGTLVGTLTGPISPTQSMASPPTPTLVAGHLGTLATATYFYKVTALDGAGGETTAGGEASVAVTSPGSVALSWGAVAGAWGYRVYRGTSSGGEAQAYLVFGTSFTDVGGAATSATPPLTNTAFVTEISSTGASWVLGGNFGVGTSRPQARITAGPGGDVAVEMAAPSSPTVVAGTSGFMASGTYYWVVTALDASGGETRAGGESFAAVTGPSGSAALSWPAVPGAVSYKVYRGTATGAENVWYSTATNSFTDTGSSGTTATPPASCTAFMFHALAAGGVVVSTIGPSTTEQHVVPAVASDTVVLANATQTLTHKTLTNPTISGATVTNPTITSPTISNATINGPIGGSATLVTGITVGGGLGVVNPSGVGGATVTNQYPIPVGSVMQWTAFSPPPGFLILDGSGISRTSFPGLFGLWGTYYGAGDGSTTFNIPDPRSRALVSTGAGSGLSSYGLGSTGGEETHDLSQNEMPVHTHNYSDPGHAHDVGGSIINSGGGGATSAGDTSSQQSSSNGINITIDNAGGGAAHNNLQPYYGMYWIVRAA